MTDYYIVKID